MIIIAPTDLFTLAAVQLEPGWESDVTEYMNEVPTSLNIFPHIDWVCNIAHVLESMDLPWENGQVQWIVRWNIDRLRRAFLPYDEQPNALKYC